MIEYIIQSCKDFFQSGIHMYPIFIVAIVGIAIQLFKVTIDSIKYKRFYMHHVFESGGFPSFHSWLASSVTMFVLLDQWFGSTLFAVVAAFSLLFAYDAMNIRYEAGQHAHYINDLRTELEGVLQKKEVRLKERIWHLPFEVAWWIIVGSVLTFILYYYCYLVK